MELTTSHWLMLSGAGLIVLGLLLRRWASSYDLQDAAIDSAWHVVRGRRTPDNPTAIEAKLDSIVSAPTATGKATRAAGAVAGHVMAYVVGLGGLFAALAGAALVALGLAWR